MEDIPRNLSKNVKRLSEPRAARRSSRWTMLLVDENGRTIRVRGFRLLAALVALLVLGLAVAGGAAFHLLKTERAENRRLRAAAAASAEALRGAAEPRTPAFRPTTEPDAAPPPAEPAPETPVSAARPAESAEVPASEPRAGEAPALPPERVFSSAPAGDAETSSEPAPVAVERVVFPEEDRYAVRFRLRNVAPDSEPISGHVVVVLRLADGGHAALPEVPLVEGRPTGKVEGSTFSIQNYRPMRFRAEPDFDGDRVRGATAFVFDSDGRPLLETPLNAEAE